jgi:hypothetical protein
MHDDASSVRPMTLAGWIPPEERERDRSVDEEEPPPSRVRQRIHRSAVVTIQNPDGSTRTVSGDMIDLYARPRPRGFAAMTAEQRRAISAKGGASSNANGKGHRFTSATGRAARQKSGQSRVTGPAFDGGRA